MKLKPVYLMILGVLLLAGCGGEQQAAGPDISAPAATVSPVVATPVPAGEQANPLRLVFVPQQGSFAQAQAQEEELEAAIIEATNVTVDVVLLESEADALGALCNPQPDRISAAWLGGFPYAAALAQNCGTPAIKVLRDLHIEVAAALAADDEDEEEEEAPLAAGIPGLIVLSRTLGTGDFTALNGRTFCRLGFDDFYSWLLPSVVLSGRGVTVPDRLGEVVDYDDVALLVAAVGSGDCAGAGISQYDLDEIAAVDDTPVNDLRVVDNLTSPPVPFAVLLVPPDVQPGIRLSLLEGLLALAADPDGAELLRPYLGQDALAAIEAGDFADFTDFLAGLGLDLVQLGN